MIREYRDNYEVDIDITLGGNYVIRVYQPIGDDDNCFDEEIAEIDLHDLIKHLKEYYPELLK